MLCGGLIETGPQKLINSGTIGLVAVSEVLLEELCQWQWVLSFTVLKPGLMSLFLLLADKNVELSAPSLSPHLPARHDVSHDDDDG